MQENKVFRVRVQGPVFDEWYTVKAIDERIARILANARFTTKNRSVTEIVEYRKKQEA